MQAAACEETGTSFEVSRIGDEIGTGVLEAPVGAVEISGTGWGLPSSFFHIWHLDHENWIFEAADRVLGGTATQKREDSTALSGCKQVCGVANLACFLKRYTIFCGFSPAISTMDSDISFFSLSTPGHQIPIIPAVTLFVNYII